MRVTESVAPPAYWDELYGQRKLTYDEEYVLFKELFAKYLTPGGSCFEVGCYPGGFLIYLGKTFGYTVGGIDTTPAVATALPDFVRLQGVRVSEFVCGDFFTYQPDQQFDVVCSFGFIEHFRNFEDVIRLHLKLIKPGGMLILSCPNFRKAQGLFRRVFDRANLKRHILEAMDFRRWRAVLAESGMKVVYQSYYGTCELWRERDGVYRPIRDRISDRLIRWSRRLDRRFSFPNPFTSPYMIVFARKPLDRE